MEKIEMNQKKFTTPDTLLSAGFWLSVVSISAMTSHPKAVKSALESLKLILDTNEFADLSKECEHVITIVNSLPPDKPLDEGNRALVMGQATAWNRIISDRIKTYQLSSPKTLLNPESLNKGPAEWIHESTLNKLDMDTQLDLFKACLSELHGLHDSTVYLVIRATKRIIASFEDIEKEIALEEANRIIKGEKEAPNELIKRTLLKYLPSLLKREEELNSFKIMSNRESSETLTTCFNLINELASGSPFTPEGSA